MRENSYDHYVGSIEHNGEGLAIVGNSQISFIAPKIRVDMSPKEPLNCRSAQPPLPNFSHFIFGSVWDGGIFVQEAKAFPPAT